MKQVFLVLKCTGNVMFDKAYLGRDESWNSSPMKAQRFDAYTDALDKIDTFVVSESAMYAIEKFYVKK